MKIVQIYDYSMTYLNSIRIQKYLNDEEFFFTGPTYSTLFRDKYYRKIYNKLKHCDSVGYTGINPDPYLEVGIRLIYTLSDRSKAVSNLEIDVFNQLNDMRILDNYEFNDANAYWLFDYILSFSDELSFFEDKNLVISLCENYLTNKGSQHSSGEDKLMIVYIDR